MRTLWQSAHFGPRVRLWTSSFSWQPRQSLGASLYRFDLWQESQATFTWLPASGKRVFW